MMSNDNNRKSPENRPYQVGYGKPPKHTRFKPGQSGNPRGRMKKHRSAKVIFEDILNQKVEVKMRGKALRMTMLEAILHSVFRKALAGQPAAIRAFLDLRKTFHGLGIGEPGIHFGVMRVPQPIKDAEEWSAGAQKQQREAAAKARELHQEREEEIKTNEPQEQRPPRKVRVVRRKRPKTDK